jgi:hypothetical protein
MTLILGLPTTRFLNTLEIVAKEGRHLSYSWSKLFSQPIDVAWVASLEQDLSAAEQLETFVSRSGKMQDAMADKLLPRWLIALDEVPCSQIETLNCAERLGILNSTERWLEACSLRNRLEREYMTNPEKVVEDLALAKEYSLSLMESFNSVRQDSITRMGYKKEGLPEELALPGQDISE